MLQGEDKAQEGDTGKGQAPVRRGGLEHAAQQGQWGMTGQWGDTAPWLKESHQSRKEAREGAMARSPHLISVILRASGTQVFRAGQQACVWGRGLLKSCHAHREEIIETPSQPGGAVPLKVKCQKMLKRFVSFHSDCTSVLLFQWFPTGDK